MRIKLYKPLQIFELGKRENQEDALFPSLGNASSSDNLFIVCDGMGGHEHGEVASNTITSALSEEILKRYSEDKVFEDDLFIEALNEAYLKLDEQNKGRRSNMGTTMVMVLFHKGGALVANIGDSRIYHIRPSENKILYKSRDHSLVFELFQAGEITKEEMSTHPRRNVITRAMKPGKDSRAEADITHITDVCPGDFFYLCSDGMIESMSDDEILSLFSSEMNNEDRITMLTQATVDNSDNHTAYLLQVESVVLEQNDSSLLNDEQTVRWNALRYEKRKTQEPKPITPPPFKPKSITATPDDVHSIETANTANVSSVPNIPQNQENCPPMPLPQPQPDPMPMQQENIPSQASFKKSNKLLSYGLIIVSLCFLIGIAFWVFNKCSSPDNKEDKRPVKQQKLEKKRVVKSVEKEQINQFKEQQETQQSRPQLIRSRQEARKIIQFQKPKDQSDLQLNDKQIQQQQNDQSRPDDGKSTSGEPE